jgi:hypothetical protein
VVILSNLTILVGVELTCPLQEVEDVAVAVAVAVAAAVALAGVLQMWGKIIFMQYKTLLIEGLDVLEVLTCHRNRIWVVVSETRSLVLVPLEILAAMECHSRIMVQSREDLNLQETLGTIVLVSDQRLVGLTP